MHPLANSQDASLRARAASVVPGGMWGHQNAANLPQGYPQFFSRGECLNGPTDATTTCVTIARAETSRRKVLVATGSYHGAMPWCSPSVAGVTTEDRAHILAFGYNDVASLERAADMVRGNLATIIVATYRTPITGVTQTSF